MTNPASTAKPLGFTLLDVVVIAMALDIMGTIARK